MLALQGELASAIAREIHAELTLAEESRLASAQRINPEAYDAYLRGRYFFNRPSDENLQKAPSARAAQAASLLYSQAKTAPPMTPSTKPQTRPTNAPA